MIPFDSSGRCRVSLDQEAEIFPSEIITDVVTIYDMIGAKYHRVDVVVLHGDQA
jgi:hypothetical protein